jgi:hypothetical protein
MNWMKNDLNWSLTKWNKKKMRMRKMKSLKSWNMKRSWSNKLRSWRNNLNCMTMRARRNMKKTLNNSMSYMVN